MSDTELYSTTDIAEVTSPGWTVEYTYEGQKIIAVTHEWNGQLWVGSDCLRLLSGKLAMDWRDNLYKLIRATRELPQLPSGHGDTFTARLKGGTSDKQFVVIRESSEHPEIVNFATAWRGIRDPHCFDPDEIDASTVSGVVHPGWGNN